VVADEDAALRDALTRRDLPRGVERWRVELSAGATRPAEPGEWAGALVLVERGALDVECRVGGTRSFVSGDLLALGWLPLRRLRNPGDEPVSLLAVRRNGIIPIHEFLRVTRATPTTPEGGHRMKFRTVIELGGKTATGFRVPDEVVDGLGAGKRPPVHVRIGPHAYRSTVAVMDGVSMLPLSAENRTAAGVAAGDEVEVELELDTDPREVEVPVDLATALDAEPDARRTFDGLSNSNKKWHVLQVTGAKTDETRQRRIARSVATLREGRAR
jgi:hypothetical protein